MIGTTECHERPADVVINGPRPESPAGIVCRAARLLEDRANVATGGPWNASPVFSPDATATSGVYSFAHPSGSVESEVVASGRIKPGYGGIRQPHNAVFIAALDPDVAKAIAAAWEHLADDMADYYGHFHAVPIGWVVVDEQGTPRADWTATVRAALEYLRETAPEVAE